MGKGLSWEEKRSQVLAMLHEKQLPMLLKEIEKQAPKRGVVSQSVKEVVQSLVNDDLAHCEKLGTSNFYWAFPAERTQKARHKQQRLQKREQELTESKLKQHERLDHAKAAVPDNEERKAARERYDTASARLHQLEQEEERLANIGNAKDFTETIQSAVKGINIYTDNIFLLGEWLQAKAGGDKGTVQDFFQREDIDVENLDYMNLPPEAA